MTLDANYYKDNSDIQQALANEILCKHAFTKHDHILDVGCGEGKITHALACLATEGKVIGNDTSAEMIALAKSTYGQQKTNLTFQVKDAATTAGFGTEQYNVITSLNCLYWVRDIEQALKNIWQALKPGGTFLGLIYPKESEYWRPLESTLKASPQWQSYYAESCCPHWKTGAELQALLKQLGFEDQQSSFEPGLVTCTEQEYLNYVRGWIPCLFTAAREEHEAFMQEALNHAKQHYWHNNTLEIPFTKLHLYAIKPGKD